jgi:hypothetical protein
MSLEEDIEIGVRAFCTESMGWRYSGCSRRRVICRAKVEQMDESIFGFQVFLSPISQVITGYSRSNSVESHTQNSSVFPSRRRMVWTIPSSRIISTADLEYEEGLTYKDNQTTDGVPSHRRFGSHDQIRAHISRVTVPAAVIYVAWFPPLRNCRNIYQPKG